MVFLGLRSRSYIVGKAVGAEHLWSHILYMWIYIVDLYNVLYLLQKEGFSCGAVRVTLIFGYKSKHLEYG